ncbi:MAG: glycosyltransferase family 2 protein [Nitrospirae bacterium]|nr:MAG: glycosyltransferase family 2 protein [Nitrospirota bacterium]
MEIFVVDNGSTDGSQEMVKKRFPMVKLIENSSNRGFAAANNQAIKISKGEFILLLNSDTLLFDDSIERLLMYMKEHPNVGIAGLQLLNSDGTIQHSIANTPSLITELTNKSLLRRLFPKRFYDKNYFHSGVYDVDSLIGACMMVRASLIRSIGLLDEDYFFFLEETDWCLRAKKHGWRVVFLPDLHIYHLQGGSAKVVPVEARIEYWRSRYTFFKKHYGELTNYILRFGLFIRLLLDTLFSASLSPFSKRAGERLSIYKRLLLWHILGMPRNWGLNK